MSTVDWRGDEFVRQVLEPAIHDGLKSGGIALQWSMERVLSRSKSPSSPGEPPGVGVGWGGGLLGSIVVGAPQRFRVDVGSTLPYAVVLDQGAIISAKRKMLTVPLNPKAKRLRRQNKSLRDVSSPKLSFVRSKKGAFLVRHIGGKSRRSEYWYRLVRQIEIQARPWLDRSVEEGKADILKAFVKGTVTGLKQRAFRGVAI